MVRRAFLIALFLRIFVQTPPTQSLILRGTIVTPDAVIADGVITIDGATITSVAPASAASPAAIKFDGVMFPGLIDLHDHLTWNALPRWRPPHLFSDRYEWQESSEYETALVKPHSELLKQGFECDLNRYAEVKAIVNGATSTVGGVNNPCARGLARNLDSFPDLPGMTSTVENSIFPLEIRSPCDEQAVRDVGGALEDCALTPGESKPAIPRAVVAHLGEGSGAAARREFTMFAAHGYLRSGVSIIHGVGLRPEQFKQMAAHDVGLIWSPRSNIELYGVTTDVAAAKAAGVTIAVAPDWSPSGSTGMLAELAYVDAMRTTHPQLVRFTNKELGDMATVHPARLARLDRAVGKLAFGYAADFVVMRRRTDDDAYAALVKQTPTDVRLVVIAGQPVYGEADLMKELVPNGPLETIDVCGQTRTLNVQTGTPDHTAWATTESRLQAVLRTLDMTLAPLVECSSE
ncbi:MAG TPA: amidohydrolase family protein [Vicinamibacterales bacterium]